MGGHMLKYHVALPLAVFGGLMLFGVPFAGAVRYGITAGCVAMMLMMLRGNPHDHDNGRTHDEGDLDRAVTTDLDPVDAAVQRGGHSQIE